MTKMTIALLVGLLLAAPAVAEDEAGTTTTWYADFDKAVEAAKAEGKDLLVDFTGSDWCGWCKRLHAEVFDHQEFKDGVMEKFVLVALDFPNDPAIKAKVPNPARNDELKGRFGVRGFPTILLMTPDGEVYGKTGYQKGGPTAYLTHLAEISEAGKKIVAAAKAPVTAWEKAPAEGKAAAIDEAIKALQGYMDNVKTAREAFMADRQNAELRNAGMQAENELLLGGLVLLPAVKAGIEADPKNESGLMARSINVLMDSGKADAGVLDAAEAFDAKNEHGLLERVLQARFGMTNPREPEVLKALLAKIEAFEKLDAGKNMEVVTMLYANSAFCYDKYLSDNAKAAHFANKLVEMGAVEKNPRLKGLVDKILAAAPKEEPAEEKPAEK